LRRHVLSLEKVFFTEMEINLDNDVIWQSGLFKINSTIFFTWVMMAMVFCSLLVFKMFLTNGKKIGSLQNFFELLVGVIEEQVKQSANVDLRYVFPFIATMFIFILSANLFEVIPFFEAPTASLSTTAALSLSTVMMGIFYGIKRVGAVGFLRKYLRPTPVMCPMNIIGDVSSTFSLTMRLYGNMMSGMVIGMVVTKISFLSLGFPIFLNILSLMTCTIQAYIFSILSMSFITSAEE